jgi:biotin carboxyl carrier protein
VSQRALEIDSEGLKVKIDWHRSGAPVASPATVTEVRSPVTGTFYRTGQGDKPLVSEGDAVTVGQVLCGIDIDGQSNEIESEVEGTITAILFKPGEPVKAGKALFEIKPA